MRKATLPVAALAAAVLLTPVAASGVSQPHQHLSAEAASEHIDVTFTPKQIDAAVKDGEKRERDGDTTPGEERAEDRLIAVSEAQGAPLTDADIDVFTLGDGLVEAAVPETVDLQKVVVEGDTGSDVAIAASADASDDASIATSGPGLGSWGERADGQYILTVKNPALGPSNVIGTGTFLWSRERYVNDGSNTYDWWMYSRKGIGQAKNIFGDNWQIKDLVVQSYPYDSIESRLVNWTGIDPSSDFKGQCSSHTFSTGLSTPVFNAGYSFTDCDKYNVTFNPNIPGSYRIRMDQGSVVNEGGRSAAYTVGWKSKQGTPGSMHDYQLIRFVKTPLSTNYATCRSYEKSATCEGYGP